MTEHEALVRRLTAEAVRPVAEYRPRRETTGLHHVVEDDELRDLLLLVERGVREGRR